MKIYDNIKTYFLNDIDETTDYNNQFYIRTFSGKNLNTELPDPVYFEPHKRDFFEIGIIARHNKNMMIGDQTFYKMTNGLAIISPFQTISYGKSNSGVDDDDEGYVIYFKSSILEGLNQPYEVQNRFPFFKMHTLPLYYLSEDDFSVISVLAESLYQESRNNEIHSLEVISSLLSVLLYKVKRVTYNNEGIVTLNRFDVIMSKFENAIQSTHTNFLSVNEYASMLNISPIYLTECVKKATGKSAQKIIIDYKVLQAKTLLHQKEKSILEVADALGFNEVSNFNQFFKRNVGITASQFRKQ
ncbi:helix-turn-helix transcriptional regulator [uncultured Formosa sp.]|uniref:AraC family transcriptional regulator n=1 Tax=uncultured Formosa sp. TaxID=255435 RepID=UPI002601E187|nr:helix-turn-helix transcriptional regulator [uncultured Formosa sp.]